MPASESDTFKASGLLGTSTKEPKEGRQETYGCAAAAGTVEAEDPAIGGEVRARQDKRVEGKDSSPSTSSKATTHLEASSLRGESISRLDNQSASQSSRQ